MINGAIHLTKRGEFHSALKDVDVLYLDGGSFGVVVSMSETSSVYILSKVISGKGQSVMVSAFEDMDCSLEVEKDPVVRKCIIELLLVAKESQNPNINRRKNDLLKLMNAQVNQ